MCLDEPFLNVCFDLFFRLFLTPQCRFLTPPQELSNTLWALCRLGHIPDAAWLDLFWSESYCQLHHFSAQQLANTLWAAVRLGQAPEGQWLQAFFKVGTYCAAAGT